MAIRDSAGSHEGHGVLHHARLALPKSSDGVQARSRIVRLRLGDLSQDVDQSQELANARGGPGYTTLLPGCYTYPETLTTGQVTLERARGWVPLTSSSLRA